MSAGSRCGKGAGGLKTGRERSPMSKERENTMGENKKSGCVSQALTIRVLRSRS